MEKKKFNPVHCRICGEIIDRNIEKEGIDWVMPSKNWFYHKKCYDDWKNQKDSNDEDYWAAMIYDYLARELKVSYNYWKCEKQRTKFLKSNMTNKGIYFALKWFVEVNKGSLDESYGGIGIVPYIYEDSCNYWVAQEKKQKGFMKELEKQLLEASSRQTITVYQQKKKKTAFKTYDLSDVEGED